MFGLQARTKQTNFLRLLKGEGDEPGFFTRVKVSLQGGRRWPGGGCSAIARRRDDVSNRAETIIPNTRILLVNEVTG